MCKSQKQRQAELEAEVVTEEPVEAVGADRELVHLEFDPDLTWCVDDFLFMYYRLYTSISSK